MDAIVARSDLVFFQSFGGMQRIRVFTRAMEAIVVCVVGARLGNVLHARIFGAHYPKANIDS